MNLSELLQLTRIYIDDPNSDRVSDTKLTILLNRGQEELQKVIDDTDEGYFWACQNYAVTASSSSFEFNLPSNFKKAMLAEQLPDASSDPIPVIWSDFRRRHYNYSSNIWFPTITFAPVAYIRSGKIGVVKPNTSYTLRLWYVKRLMDLATSGDVSEIPLEFHNLICLHAAMLLSGSEQRDFALINEYGAELQRLQTTIEPRQRQEPRYVNISDSE